MIFISNLLRVFITLSLFLMVSVGAQAQSSGGIQSKVKVQGNISSIASHGGNATTHVGSTHGGCSGSSTTMVGGSIQTYAHNKTAKTVIGDPCKNGKTLVGKNVINYNGEQKITGDAMIMGNSFTADGTRSYVGGDDKVIVGGNVKVLQGTLELGGVCAGKRNGQCCLEFYTGMCVIDIQPPNPKTGCPPAYVYTGNLCRLYSDFSGHRVGR